MKKVIPAMCIGFLICFVLSAYMDSTERALAEGLIRLHVVANSDSDADQELKLLVRDRILKEWGGVFSEKENIDAVKSEIADNLDLIKETAEDEIRKNGYDYKVDVSYGTENFPRKEYGGITLPAGEYRALKVNIGSAQGKNWWCVLFPPLCFVDETCVNVSEASVSALKSNLGDDTYKMVSSEDVTVELRLKSYELWQKGKQMLLSIGENN